MNIVQIMTRDIFNLKQDSNFYTVHNGEERAAAKAEKDKNKTSWSAGDSVATNRLRHRRRNSAEPRIETTENGMSPTHDEHCRDAPLNSGTR